MLSSLVVLRSSTWLVDTPSLPHGRAEAEDRHSNFYDALGQPPTARTILYSLRAVSSSETLGSVTGSFVAVGGPAPGSPRPLPGQVTAAELSRAQVHGSGRQERQVRALAASRVVPTDWTQSDVLGQRSGGDMRGGPTCACQGWEEDSGCRSGLST